MELHRCDSGQQEPSSHVRRRLSNKRPAEALSESSSIRASFSHLTSGRTAHRESLVVERQSFPTESNPVDAVAVPAVVRRHVVLCEERNVAFPGRLVASRDEIRSSWLGRSDFKRIQADNLRSLAAIKREMTADSECSAARQPSPITYSLSACPRGLELYVTKLQTRKKKCSPQRLLSRGVVDLYRQSSASDAEQLRSAYRLLTHSDRQRAVRVAYLDELEAYLLSSTPSPSDHLISTVQGTESVRSPFGPENCFDTARVLQQPRTVASYQ